MLAQVIELKRKTISGGRRALTQVVSRRKRVGCDAIQNTYLKIEDKDSGVGGGSSIAPARKGFLS